METVTFIHSLPGRLRIKIRKLKGNEDECAKIAHYLSSRHGISKACANEWTGSVVVCYDPEIHDSDSILLLLRNNGCFDPIISETQSFFQVIGLRFIDEIIKSFLSLALKKSLEQSGLGFIAVLI
jgi:hypothetical protein